MIFRSIKSRLLLSLTLFIALSLGLSGFALDRAFRSSVEAALQEKLKANFYSLLADSDAEQNTLVMPAQLQDPRFNQIDSGLYAFINDKHGNRLWHSPSAITLQPSPNQAASIGHFRFSPPTNDQFYRLSYGIIWELENDDEREYHVYLLQNATPVTAQLHEFRASLWRWFGGIAVILLVIQGIIMRWGLTPLRHLGKELKAIESGEQSQLTGVYPSELENATHNLNLLIENERRQRQRYHDTLSDLAHSLKTPLAILRGLNSQSLSEAEQRKSLDEQVSRMNDIVSHQLHRASSKASAANQLSMHPIPLASLINKLLRSLQKVYISKSVDAENLINSNLSLRVDEHDLMEIFGNLLDNACKACRQKIRISASQQQGALIISIEDDGEGIAEQQRQNVLERGGRADTQHPGQGIGLAVTQDILNSYQARLSIHDSQLGGAKIDIEFPVS